jgi:hypothetical protein
VKECPSGFPADLPPAVRNRPGIVVAKFDYEPGVVKIEISGGAKPALPLRARPRLRAFDREWNLTGSQSHGAATPHRTRPLLPQRDSHSFSLF